MDDAALSREMLPGRDHGPERTGKAGASLRSEEPGRGARVHSMRRRGAPCDPPKAWTEAGSLREATAHVSALAPLPASRDDRQ